MYIYIIMHTIRSLLYSVRSITRNMQRRTDPVQGEEQFRVSHDFPRRV